MASYSNWQSKLGTNALGASMRGYERRRGLKLSPARLDKQILLIKHGYFRTFRANFTTCCLLQWQRLKSTLRYFLFY